MKLSLKRGLLAVAAILALAMPVLAAAATPAAAAPRMPEVVLVNQPPATVWVGQTFPVGVWYQSYSGGSRHYHLAVYAPRQVGGQLIFYRSGYATTTWAIWHVLARWRGWYKIVYHMYTYPGRVWTRYVAYTVSR